MTQAKTLRQRMKDGEVLVALRGSIKTDKNESVSYTHLTLPTIYSV